MIFLQGSRSQGPLHCTFALDNGAIIHPSVPVSFYARPFMIFQCSYPVTLIPALLHVLPFFFPFFSPFPCSEKNLFLDSDRAPTNKTQFLFLLKHVFVVHFLPRRNIQGNSQQCAAGGGLTLGSKVKKSSVVDVPRNQAILFCFFSFILRMNISRASAIKIECE